MSKRKAVYHSLERTSPKGGPSLSTCRLCGTQNLPFTAVWEECPNQRGLTEDEALFEALDPPITRTAPSGVKP